MSILPHSYFVDCVQGFSRAAGFYLRSNEAKCGIIVSLWLLPEQTEIFKSLLPLVSNFMIPTCDPQALVDGKITGLVISRLSFSPGLKIIAKTCKGCRQTYMH